MADVMIDVQDVTMRFHMNTDKIMSLKEYVTRKIKRSIEYSDFTALDHVSFSVEAGETLGLIGHNGAGKSTTLRSAAGIQQFDRGEIEVCGISLKDAPLDCKRMMAYIPDNPDLYE